MVVKSTTGQALSKARVTLRKAEGSNQQFYFTTTDGGGRFLLQDVDPGSYSLWVERPGYLGQGYEQKMLNAVNNTLALAPGESRHNIVLRLIPTGAISGQVFDEDGEPVQGVMVQVLQSNWWGGRRQLNPTMGAQTDDRGEYRVFGLAPGKYYLSAVYPDAGGMSSQYGEALNVPSGGDETYVPTYYPGTTEVPRALLVELKAGDEMASMDFFLQPVKAVRVRGRMMNSSSGQPARGACLALMPREGGFAGYMFNRSACAQDEQGTFELRGVTPGTYALTANFGDNNKYYSARLPLDVGPTDFSGVDVLLVQNFDLRGHLSIEGSADFKPSDFQVYLQSREQPNMGGAWAAVKADGSFALQNLPEDDYRVGINGGSSDCYLKSARLGIKDGVGGNITVSRDHSSETLQLEVSAAGGHVEGAALNDQGKPFAGAHVVLVPAPERRGQAELFREINTGEDGRFTFWGIAPGEYKLFAWPSAEGVAYQDPDWLVPFESRGVPLRVLEGDHQKAQVQVIALNNSSP